MKAPGAAAEGVASAAPDVASAPADATPGVRLQLLRTPLLLLAGAAPLPLNRLDAALLAVLAVDGPTSRARIVAWLWPEHDAEAARNVLRQRLFRLRRAAGHDLVVADELLALAPGIGHDLVAPETVLALDANGAAGELLGDAGYDDLLAFGDWLAAARAQWRAARREALAAIAARLESEDRLALALSYADRLARDEPLLEHAQRRLMRLHYRRGDRGAALAAYTRFAAALDRELGETPGRETRDLLDLIESNDVAPAAASPPRPVAMLRPPRLVGRAAEWQRLEAAFDAGRLGVVAGEPGIGKSRLVGDFAAARRLVVVPTRPGDARLPYALLARLLRSLAGGSASAAAAATEAAAGTDDFVRGELARIVPEFGAAAAGRLDPLRLQRATARFIAAGRPAGIAIDDLQFADDATLDMLPGLVAGTDGVHWLVALRANEEPAAVAAWLGALDPGTHERIALGPLDVDGVHALLATLALPEIAPAAWAARVHRHSGGNPLFILETLLALLAGGVLPGDGVRLPLPENLRVLIERRLGQLSTAALKLARVAALAGADFSVDVAAGVLEQHPLDLLEAWRELEAAQVVRDAAFAHDLILEASRDSVPPALRRWLHGRIAAVLEQQDRGAPLRLAHHWREAGEPARAAVQYLRAADLAQAAGRLSEESRLLEAAIECHAQAGDPAGRFDAMARRATSALESLSPTEALQAANALAAAAADAREHGIAHKHLAACHMNGARFDLAAPALERAIASSDAAGDSQNANHARYLHVLALAQTVGVGSVVERLERLLPWAESQPDESLRHSFFADWAILLDQADQRRRARPYFERALGYFERRHETGNAASTRMMYARSLLMVGELDMARGQLEAAVRDRDELSEGEGGQGIEVLNLGRAYAELGLYAEALALLEPSRERLARHGLAIVAGASALVIARVHAYLGQIARAQAMCRELPDDPPFHLRAALLWSKALLLRERPGERRRLLDAAVAEFAQTDLPFVRLPIQFDQVACTSDDASIDACRALVAECERRELPAPQMLGRMRLAQMLLARGDTATALAVVQGLVPDLETCLPVGTYLPEFHWVCHLAARDGGDAALAAHCLAAAAQWIRTTAAAHVPAAFRESFLQRNPINRAILAAAARR